MTATASTLGTGGDVPPVLAAIGVAAPRDGAPATHVALPSRRRARVLLPRGSRRAAGAVLRRAGGGLPGGRVVREVLAAGVGRIGLPALPGTGVHLADDLPAHLRRVVGDRVVDAVDAVAVRVGPPRPNAKPVVQLLDRRGVPVAWAKVGWDARTRPLVEAEAAALARLARLDLPSVTVPTVAHAGSFGSLSLLVTLPLPQVRPADPAVLGAGLADLAGAAGARRAVLRDSAWSAAVWERATAHGGVLADVADRVVAAHGDHVVDLGLVHGDLTPWNAGAGGRGLVVWDWERLQVDGPIGLDALHHALAAGGPDGEASWEVRLAAAAREAAAVQPGPRDWEVLGHLYLLDQLARHLPAGDAAPPPLRARLAAAADHLRRALPAA